MVHADIQVRQYCPDDQIEARQLVLAGLAERWANIRTMRGSAFRIRSIGSALQHDQNQYAAAPDCSTTRYARFEFRDPFGNRIEIIQIYGPIGEQPT